MYKRVLQLQEDLKASVIVLDIDGTLKDLCKEHENALKATLEVQKVSYASKAIVLFVNKIAMSMVKLGAFSTNNTKQEILTFVFAILSFRNYKKFRKAYYANYENELCLFDDVKKLLNALEGKAEVYFATVNKQNYNLEECGIKADRIICEYNQKKLMTYLKLYAKFDIRKEKILIVGDNFFDDILSAKRLKVESLMVNRYGSKLKEVVCKILKISI